MKQTHKAALDTDQHPEAHQDISPFEGHDDNQLRTFDGRLIPHADVVSVKDMGFGSRITLEDGSHHYTPDEPMADFPF